MLTYKMSVKCAVSWTADSLRRAIQLGTAVLKQNPGGKSDCWRKFRLIETDEGEPIFGWAACVDCSTSTCLLFKMKGEEGTVKFYGTKNLTDHSKTCERHFSTFNVRHIITPHSGMP